MSSTSGAIRAWPSMRSNIPASAGTCPVLRAVGPSSTSGWGLQLVDRLASEWGVETGTGTRVWCEIATG